MPGCLVSCVWVGLFDEVQGAQGQDRHAAVHEVWGRGDVGFADADGGAPGIMSAILRLCGECPWRLVSCGDLSGGRAEWKGVDVPDAALIPPRSTG